MKVVDKLVTKLINDGAIEEEDREIYEYGFEHGIILMLNIICTILIGIGMKMFWEVLVFMLAYIPLRTNAGGFHAKTQLRCFFYSNLLVVIILEFAKLLVGNTLVLIAMAVASVLVIIPLAPVEDQNKPLDENEVMIYGRKARIALVADLAVAAILNFVPYKNGTSTIVVSVFSLAVFLIMGDIKNKRLKSRKNEVE